MTDNSLSYISKSSPQYNNIKCALNNVRISLCPTSTSSSYMHLKQKCFIAHLEYLHLRRCADCLTLGGEILFIQPRKSLRNEYRFLFLQTQCHLECECRSNRRTNRPQRRTQQHYAEDQDMVLQSQVAKSKNTLDM